MCVLLLYDYTYVYVYVCVWMYVCVNHQYIIDKSFLFLSFNTFSLRRKFVVLFLNSLFVSFHFVFLVIDRVSLCFSDFCQFLSTRFLSTVVLVVLLLSIEKKKFSFADNLMVKFVFSLFEIWLQLNVWVGVSVCLFLFY